MAIIEGVGDEVVWAGLIVLFLLVAFVAWLSTYVAPANGWLNNAINMGPGNVWLVQLHGWSGRPSQPVSPVESSTTEVSSEPPSTIPTDDSTVRTGVDLPTSRVSPSGPQLPDDKEVESCTQPTAVQEVPEEKATEHPGVQLPVPEVSQPSLVTEPVDIRTRIRLKFLDETQKLVASLLSQTVGQFKREHFDEAVQEGQVIRLIYNGQLLRDDNRSLESYGLSDNCVVHCHVSNTPISGQSQHQPRRGSQTLPGIFPSQNGLREDPDNRQSFIGRHIFLVVGINFAALWLGWLKYSHFFDFTAFFSLVVCTVVYLSFLYASRLRTHVGPATQQPAAQ